MHSPRGVGKALRLNSNLTSFFVLVVCFVLFFSFLKIIEVGREREERRNMKHTWFTDVLVF